MYPFFGDVAQPQLPDVVPQVLYVSQPQVTLLWVGG